MLTPEEEAEAERRSSFLVKQLLFFWPMVENADDADRVARLNYWLCVQYAGWNLLSGLATLFLFHSVELDLSSILLIVTFCVFFFLGANGVRRSSIAAAWGVTFTTGVAIVNNRMDHGTFSPTPILIFIASLVVLRGTILTARWQRQHGNDAADPLRIEKILPVQLDTSFTRSMADRWPAQLWPRLQWLFWLTGAALLAEPILYAVLLLQDRLRI